jgi:hypothetical protein
MYKIIQDQLSRQDTSIQRSSDGAFIPFDPANTDYQEYLKWLDEGNTPEPANE